MFDNGVINLDALSGPTVLGHVYGGIFCNQPHSRIDGAVSGASNNIFEVIYTPVPEPGALAILLVPIALIMRRAKVEK
jgi:hypothetical protein